MYNFDMNCDSNYESFENFKFGARLLVVGSWYLSVFFFVLLRYFSFRRGMFYETRERSVSILIFGLNLPHGTVSKTLKFSANYTPYL